MEEFLKENEKEFLDFIEFRKKQEEEIDIINKSISKIKSDIISNNLKTGNEPYLEIEKRKIRIEQIKEEINKLGVASNVNEIKESSQSDKDIANFNIIIDVERLKKEQQKLENEIIQIIDICKNSLETKKAQEQIDNKQNIRKAIEQRIDERRKILEELINREIERKEKVLAEISKRKEEAMNKEEEDIKEKEKTLVNVIKIEFEDEDSEYLYKLKQETIEKLKNELQKMKIKLQEDKDVFIETYNINKNELNKLKKLKQDLNSNDLSRLENDLGLQQAEKQEEEIEEEKEESEIDEDEIIMDRRYIYGSNGRVLDLRNVPCRRNKKTGELEEIKPKSKLIQKAYSIFNNIKNNIKSIFNKDQENSDELETDNSNISLAERLHYEIENPETLDVQYTEYKNIEKVFEDEEK